MRTTVIPSTIKSSAIHRSRRRCAICGAMSYLRVRLIKPMELGGRVTTTNLITLCPTCNAASYQAHLRPEILTQIRNNWVGRKVLGRGRIFDLTDQYHGTASAMAALIAGCVTPNESIDRFSKTLKTFQKLGNDTNDIIRQIQSIKTEDEYIQVILKPLFEGLGFMGVRVLHHSGYPEDGKDLVFFELDRFNITIFYAVVASAQKICADSSKTHDSGHYQKILDQVSKCFTVPYEAPNLEGKYQIDRVIVASAKGLTADAMRILKHWEMAHGHRLIYLDPGMAAGHFILLR